MPVLPKRLGKKFERVGGNSRLETAWPEAAATDFRPRQFLAYAHLE